LFIISTSRKFHVKEAQAGRANDSDFERNQKRKDCKYVGTISSVRFAIAGISAYAGIVPGMHPVTFIRPGPPSIAFRAP
jgi:hypothetical protein